MLACTSVPRSRAVTAACGATNGATGLLSRGAGVVTERLATYIATAAEQELPPEVLEKTKHHVLDTFAAMVSGTELKPGRLALSYAARQGGTPDAQVVGSGQLTNVTTAALVNGMLAHADETDDSHAP